MGRWSCAGRQGAGPFSRRRNCAARQGAGPWLWGGGPEAAGGVARVGLSFLGEVLPVTIAAGRRWRRDTRRPRLTEAAHRDAEPEFSTTEEVGAGRRRAPEITDGGASSENCGRSEERGWAGKGGRCQVALRSEPRRFLVCSSRGRLGSPQAEVTHFPFLSVRRPPECRCPSSVPERDDSLRRIEY